MARTGRHMTGKEKKAWAEHFDREKKAGRTKRRGGMEFATDDRGNQFQRNGNACPGKGFDRQASHDDGRWYDYPPFLRGKTSGKKHRTWSSHVIKR